VGIFGGTALGVGGNILARFAFTLREVWDEEWVFFEFFLEECLECVLDFLEECLDGVLECLDGVLECLEDI